MRSHDRTPFLALLVGCLLAVGVVFGSHAIDRTQHVQNFAQEIQAERYNQTFNACWDQNKRHDNTVKALDKLLSSAEIKQPKRKVQIKASKSSTLLLINALVPERKCGQVAQAAIHQR